MINLKTNLTYLGTTSRDWEFDDKKGTSHKIKFMDMEDNEIYIFKIKEITKEITELKILKPYIVNLGILATPKENFINFVSIQNTPFDDKK